MKKSFTKLAFKSILLTALATIFVSCNSEKTASINVFSREEGSGTRSAFV